MDVTLPNGQVISNIPEGTTKAQLVAKLAANGHDTSWYKPEPAPASPTLGQTMEEQTQGDLGTALKTGIAKSATKTVRGIGTTLLPKVAEQWAEKKGWLPTAQDVALLEQGTQSSIPAQIASGVADVATDTVPAGLAMKGVGLGARALPTAVARSAGVGAGLGGMRAEDGNVAREAGLGALGGGVGAVLPSAVGYGLSHLVPSSQATKTLMATHGITPSIGQGADTTTLRGRAARALEDVIEPMPLIGAPARMARNQSNRQLLDEAVRTAEMPGQTIAAGPRVDRIDQIVREGVGARQAALEGTQVAVGQGHQQQMVDAITNAAEGRIAPADRDRLIGEINRRLFAAADNGRVPASTIDNLATDMFEGNMSHNNANVQAVLQQVAPRLRNWVNSSANQAGHNLTEARHSLANAYALQRAGGSDTGVSGEQLIKGVRANDKATGQFGGDSSTRELADLAELATNLRTPTAPMRSRSINQLAGAGLGEAGLGLLSGGTHALVGALNAANLSPSLRRMILNNPATREAFVRSLRVPSVVTGMESQ